MLVRLWQVSGTVRAVSRRLRALVDTHCETALEPLRQILRPLCSDAVVERLAQTRDDRKGLLAPERDAGVSLSAAIRAAKGRRGCRRDPRRGIPPRGWAVFS